MGSCLSSKVCPATAKLVHQDGTLKEFRKPVKVASIIEQNPGYFICHSDSMDYEEYMYPLHSDEELEIEQLYFLLPVAKLQYPLSASDMALLAVKANAALVNRNHEKRRSKMMPLSDGSGWNRSLHKLPSNFSFRAYSQLSRESRLNIQGRGFGSVQKLQRIPSIRTRVAYKPWKTKLDTIEEA
eukprot:Gb_01099 [translate_table: standard]